MSIQGGEGQSLLSSSISCRDGPTWSDACRLSLCRVITSTRFSTRPGADKNLYLSTYSPSTANTGAPPDQDEAPSPLGALVPTTLRGAWLEHADALGLKTAPMGPMSLGLDHEKIVVGTAGGDVYVVGMTGWGYRGGDEE